MLQTAVLSLCISVLLIQTEGWMPMSSSSSGRPRWWYQQRTLVRPYDTVAMAAIGEEDQGNSVANELSDYHRDQEILFEELSLNGADKIANLEVSERAKRAMLAEAVEDRIFELTDVLETLVGKDGLVAVENREKAVEVAMLTKKLQQQYSDLVNGKPSSILTTLDATGEEGNA